MKVADHTLTSQASEPLRVAPSAESLTGRLAEHQELIGLLAQRPGLTVITADPWSGTSALLDVAAHDTTLPQMLVVDARRAADTLDLAMVCADSAIDHYAADASGWWLGTAPPSSAAGLRLWRTLSEDGVDLDDLRLGSGRPLERLREALELAITLAGGEPIIAIDHLGMMLEAQPKAQARELLAELRAVRQAHSGLDLVLVEHHGGQLGAALRNADHPLFHAGHQLRFRRPDPQRFTSDLVITRSWTNVSVPLLKAAAELAAGVPALTWRIIELAPRDLAPGDDDSEAQTLALAGWQALSRLAAPSNAHQWDLLRRVHPDAQQVVAALSFDLPPYSEVNAAKKSVNDVLVRLRGLGFTWQPRPRRWALTDPLLAAWVREHAPSWTLHRTSQGGSANQN